MVVPTFKQTSDPIEEVFQTQNDDTIETDYSWLHSEPLDVYSRQVLYDEYFQDTLYGTDEEFNTLFMILIKVQIMKLHINKLLIKHLSPSQ